MSEMARSTSTVTLWLLLTVSLVLAVESDFTFYPTESQSCLEKSYDVSECEAGSVAKLNKCLCDNGGSFIENTAMCLGYGQVGDYYLEVYNTMKSACSDSSTPIAMDVTEFYNWVVYGSDNYRNETKDSTTDDESPTTSTENFAPTSTTTPINTEPPQTTFAVPSSTPVDVSGETGRDDANGLHDGLSTGATIGIGLGGAVGGAAIVGVIAFFLFRRFNKQSEESKSILPEHRDQTPTTYPPTSPSPAFGQIHEGKSSPAPAASAHPSRVSAVSSWGTPVQSNAAWNAPPDLQGQQQEKQYVPYTPFAPPIGVAELSSGNDDPPASPVEMPASIPKEPKEESRQ